MPCCRQGILAGTVLAFARALGEYGATCMIAGYTPGRTATISTTVYQLWRTDNDALALRWVMVNIAISAVVLLAVNLLEARQKRTGKGGGRSWPARGHSKSSWGISIWRSGLRRRGDAGPAGGLRLRQEHDPQVHRRDS